MAYPGQDAVRTRAEPARCEYVTIGSVRYAVRRAGVPSGCPCRCCSPELAACLGCPPRRTLDRLHRRWGRGASGDRERRPDRADRLRELTDRLRGAPRSQTAPPQPPPHSAPVLPPVPPPRTRHRASPVREPSLCCATPPRPTEDFFDADEIRLVKVEPKSIVGSYAQKTIPFRSASFSQGDFNPDKYHRGTHKQPSIFDFNSVPLKPSSPKAQSSEAAKRGKDAETSSVTTEETATEAGSTASVDSAVGSDEGLLAHVSPAPRSPPPDTSHKQFGSRSLTHPLPRKGSRDESASGSLQFLMTPRVLHELQEESDISLADSAQVHSEGASPLEHASEFSFPPLPKTPPLKACANVDCDCTNPVDIGSSVSKIPNDIPVPVYECIVKQWSNELAPTEELVRPDSNSPSNDLLDQKEDETITSEQVECLLAAVQNPSTPVPLTSRERKKPLDKSRRRKGIYITTASDDRLDLPEPVVNGDFLRNSLNTPKSAPVIISDSNPIEVCVSPADPRDSVNSSIPGDKSDDSASINGPPSPVDMMPWPKGEVELRRRRPALSHQSSDERDDDSLRGPYRKFGIGSRGDSPSECDSENGSRDRTASPSPFTPSDLSDVETRGPRRSIRPVRGPYGRMLEAPTLRANRSFDERETNRRSFSDATVPQRKTSAGSGYVKTPTHVRATSSPSKLAMIKNCVAPGADLLAELLRGSSEALSNSSNFDNVVLCLQQHNDTRTHVVVELYETEKSYVEALETLVKKYFIPLKSPEHVGLLDPSIVDEIFYQLPAILDIHDGFLEQLRRRLEAWDLQQKVGDVFIEVFTKATVMESYMGFINNWKKAKETIKSMSASRPAFAKFLDTMARDHKGRLSLDNLIIKPVQKIPRYEMLIQRLLKHTDTTHPDHKLLQDAEKEIHELLVKLNCTERESLELEQQQQTLKELEQLIEGLNNLVAPDRVFLKHETVTMSSGQGTLKNRAIFLFNDLFLITSVKRRTGTIKKPVTSYQSSIASQMEGSKYKLLMRIPLNDLEIVKAKDENIRRLMSEIDTLRDDVNTLTQISDLLAALHSSHPPLEELVKDLLHGCNKQLIDRQNSDTQLCNLDLALNIGTDQQNLTLIFPESERRSKWESMINEAKQKHGLQGPDRQAPEFLSPVPIRKTRAGLQFTCAAATLPPHGKSPDVWVCNSDGYVGQVCVLTLTPKPQVTSCNGVCNARILSIACVPPAPALTRQQTLDIPCSISPSASSAVKPGISISDPDDSCKNIRLDSSSSSEDDEDGSNSENPDADGERGSLGARSLTAQSKSLSSPHAAHSKSLSSPHAAHSKSLSSPHTGPQPHPVVKSSSNPAVDKQAMGISSGAVSTPASRQSSEESGLANQPTMWLGTEDGCVHLYNCADNIRVKKNKLKLHHNAAVHHIVYVEGKVFVALGNGDVVVYGREPDYTWAERCVIPVGSGSSPVGSMVLSSGRLWCSTHNTVKIVNPHILQIEETFQVGSDSKPIANMAIACGALWLSLQHAAQLKCYHGRSRDLLADVNITYTVTRMLNSCDDIIRQHKAACLRITALLAWKDTLWVGTSAGVLLTTPLQQNLQGPFTPHLTGIYYGHTGHVRFITHVENSVPIPPAKPPQTLKAKALSRRSANAEKLPKTTDPTKEILIISGGDGFEDFRSAQTTEDAGREDSTNHLLLWRV